MRRWVIISLLTALGCINYLTAVLLLGLRPSALEDVLSDVPATSTPLFLQAREEQTLRFAQKALIQAGFNQKTVEELPRSHALEVSLTWIRTANPYPPLLAEFSSNYTRQWSFVSFGYLGSDAKLHQITYYGGEADTTPSFLVSKVRGPSTEGGDYFVGYLFELSREVGPQPQTRTREGRVTSWRPPRVMLDSVRWRTYRGGSYNAREEITFTLLATLFEVFGIGLLAGVRLYRLRRLLEQRDA
ncbi:MAG TPA: hypothetical protein VKM72_14950 [Thermoanaerobaculia bacterium]|nr:hypothetical protein [Thermoanaerobaculia bacterium]